jgi:dTDP-4-amino-4,6-dideoxygalactose transaminase
MKLKSRLSDLAIFGGAAAFPENLYVGRPNVGSRERLFERLNDALDRRWLTNHGPYVIELERQLCERLGVRHCIPMCNGTVAMEIAIRAAGLTGEVIVPSWTFVATAHALQWQEITPVFCDVDPLTQTIDPRRIEELITPRTTGIIGVHVFGRSCDTEALEEIANRRGLRVLYDAAHAFDCSRNVRMIGNFGDAEVFSFHATKFFHSFEGGAVATNDDALAARIRLMQNFGFSDYDEVSYVGTNGKMSEVSAAMALTNLESLDEFVDQNWRNYEAYAAGLQGIPGLRLMRYDDASNRCNYQYIAVDVDEDLTGLSRDQLVEILHAEHVLARRYFYPGCHQMEPYRSYFPHARLLLPETERLARRNLVLPTGTAVDARTVRRICELLRFVVGNGQAIGSRLGSPILPGGKAGPLAA